MRIGSWPGAGFSDNAFVTEFCSGLGLQGNEIVDISDLATQAPLDLDVLIIHWPEQAFWNARGKIDSVLRAYRVLRVIRILRARRTTVVWLVHNLQPHDSSMLKRLIWRPYTFALARTVDAFCTLSPATVGIVRGAFPFRGNLPSLGLQHPTYPSPPVLKSRAAARVAQGLGVEGLILVFSGVIARYKGVLELSQTVVRSQRLKAQLVVAGKCGDPRLGADIAALASNPARLIFREGRLPESAFIDLIRAADYIVLPFRHYLHSGSIVHALSLGRAVITPRTPYAESLQSTVGSAWIRLYDDDLESCLSELPPPPQSTPDLRALSKAVVGRAMDCFLRALIEGSTGTTRPESISPVVGVD